jgi:hypothetical protein
MKGPWDSLVRVNLQELFGPTLFKHRGALRHSLRTLLTLRCGRARMTRYFAGSLYARRSQVRAPEADDQEQPVLAVKSPPPVLASWKRGWRIGISNNFARPLARIHRASRGDRCAEWRRILSCGNDAGAA